MWTVFPPLNVISLLIEIDTAEIVCVVKFIVIESRIETIVPLFSLSTEKTQYLLCAAIFVPRFSGRELFRRRALD